jgi:thiol:disulfide interchange protein
MDLKERFNNYLKNKSLWGKISDLVFVLFLIAMLLPSGRMAIGGAINRVKAMVSQPSINDNGEQISDNDYNWSLIDINDKQVNLADFKNKVIFINLWATWCPPCV